MRSRFLLVLLALSLGFARVEAESEAPAFLLVAHDDVSVKSLSRKQVSEIFLKKQTRWNDGGAIVPVDQSGSAPVRSEFSKEVHGLSRGEINDYWKNQIFMGGKVPPRIMKDDAEVLDFVRENPGAVGYVTALADTAGVVVISLSQ